MPLLAPCPPEAPRPRAYETDCSSCTVRTSEKGGVAETTCRKTLWAPSAKTWPHGCRSCDSGQCAERQDRSVSHLQGWACSSPVPPRVGRDGNAVERGTEHRDWGSAASTLPRCSHLPATVPLARANFGVSGIGI